MTNFKELPDELQDCITKLYSSALSDVMDRMGLWNQTMSYEIKPLDRSMKAFGRARTVMAVDVYEVPKDPYKLEIQSVDGLEPGDVLVVSQGGSKRASFWGELLSNASVGRDAHGVIIDGFTRDTAGILELGFPCFVKGLTPADSRGRIDVIALDVPIDCGGVVVKKGDYIFADLDGVVVIPQEHLIEVLTKASEKVKREDNIRVELRAGVSVHDVFDKYGIL
jgi:4-hydroxy-4-methyl-2-oxoglutarate aldolase